MHPKSQLKVDELCGNRLVRIIIEPAGRENIQEKVGGATALKIKKSSASEYLKFNVFEVPGNDSSRASSPYKKWQKIPLPGLKNKSKSLSTKSSATSFSQS